MLMHSVCKSFTPAKPEERQHHNAALQSLSSQRGRVQTDAPKSRATLPVRGFKPLRCQTPGLTPLQGLDLLLQGSRRYLRRITACEKLVSIFLPGYN